MNHQFCYYLAEDYFLIVILF